MRAERDPPRRLGRVEADPGLEPLSLGVDQADQRDRRAAERRGDARQVVERGLGLGVEDVVRA